MVIFNLKFFMCKKSYFGSVLHKDEIFLLFLFLVILAKNRFIFYSN